MRASNLLAVPLLLAACGGGSFGEADIQGTVGDFTFGDKVTAYHGTSYLVFVDREMDCLDMAWVTRNYFGSEPATSRLEFAAVQFSFAVNEPPTPGTFVLNDEVPSPPPVDAWRLINANPPSGSEGDIDAETGEAFRLTVDAASEEEVTGSFETIFVDGSVAGSFTTVQCRNVR